jgi:hypothetical protein
MIIAMSDAYNHDMMIAMSYACTINVFYDQHIIIAMSDACTINELRSAYDDHYE